MAASYRKLPALLLAAALVLGGCSDGSEPDAAENPKAALTQALDELGKYEGVTLEMGVDADAADVAESGVPADVAERLLDSTLTISSKGTSVQDGQAQIVFSAGGGGEVDLRLVSDALYLRADVRELVEAFGGDPAEVETTAEAFAQQGFDFAQAAVEGEWLGIEGLNALVEQFAGPQPTPDAEETAQLAERLTAILGENATVKSEGSDDVGEHLKVTVPAKETVKDVFEALQGFAGAPPLPGDGLDEIPEGDIPLDVWIDDGRLVQLEVDFVEIGTELGDPPPEGVDELVFRIGIDEFTEDVEAPEDFTSVNLQEILGPLFGSAPVFDSGSDDASG